MPSQLFNLVVLALTPTVNTSCVVSSVFMAGLLVEGELDGVAVTLVSPRGSSEDIWAPS